MPHAKTLDELPTITWAVAAKLLDLSRQRIERLVSEGWIKRESPGKFRLEDVIGGYLKFMRQSPTRTASAGDARVRDLRAQELEVRTAQRLGKLAAVEEFDAMCGIIGGLFISELVGQPARVTRDLALRRVIERDVHGIRERVAVAAEQIAARLPDTRPLGAAIRNATAGSVGGGQSNLPANGADSGAA